MNIKNKNLGDDMNRIIKNIKNKNLGDDRDRIIKVIKNKNSEDDRNGIIKNIRGVTYDLQCPFLNFTELFQSKVMCENLVQIG